MKPLTSLRGVRRHPLRDLLLSLYALRVRTQLWLTGVRARRAALPEPHRGTDAALARLAASGVSWRRGSRDA
ncbi:MAG TPA: hypothetical protein VMK05_12925 [Burkholderiales bacterium]|nr:hypothetical protein [Burkholderiales bacterium]